MPNQYKNKVIYGDSVLMDITDTTAEAGDVASGAVFYAKNGARTVGTFTQAQSDWVEDDTTDPAFILNRTHYKESIGNYGEIDLSYHYISLTESSYTDSVISKTYSYKTASTSCFSTQVNGFPNFLVSDFDTSATSAKININGVEYTLTQLYVPGSSESAVSYFYYYNDDVLAKVGVKSTYLDHFNVSFYTNSIDDIDIPNVILYAPSSIENYHYYTLDNRYLDGVLPKRGLAYASEVFNEQPRSAAKGLYSHAEGNKTQANGHYAHAEGINTLADGTAPHAEGYNTWANKIASHAEGQHGTAFSDGAHVEGAYSYSLALSITLTGEANATTYTVVDYDSNKDIIKNPNLLIGYYCSAKGARIIDEVRQGGMHRTITLDKTLNATEAITEQTFTFYCTNAAYGQGSHAEGIAIRADGAASHAEGYNTNAVGIASHAEGRETIAKYDNQHVQGKYNLVDPSGLYADIVGNGTSDSARSNAYTLDWSGNGWFAGKVSAGTVATPASVTNDNDLTTKQYVDNNFISTNVAGDYISKFDLAHIEYLNVTGSSVNISKNIQFLYSLFAGAVKTYFMVPLSQTEVIPMEISHVDMGNGIINLFAIINDKRYTIDLHQEYNEGQMLNGMSGTLNIEYIAKPAFFGGQWINYGNGTANPQYGSHILLTNYYIDGTLYNTSLLLYAIPDYEISNTNSPLISLYKGYTESGIAITYEKDNSSPYHPVWNWDAGEHSIAVNQAYVYMPKTIPSASSSTPLVDGTAAVGTSTNYARADHVHPVSSLSALSDTNISSPSVGQALVYDGTSSKWVNASVSASDIGAIPAPEAASEGQFLTYQQLSQGVYRWGVTDLNVELNDTSAIFYELEPTNGGGFIVEETFANIYQIFSSTRKTYFIAINSSTGQVCIFTIVGVNSYTQTILLLSASDIHEENFLRLTLYADNEHNLMYGSISTITIPNLYDTTLQILSDTTISNPSSGQVLTYDGTSSKWINSTLTLPSASSSAPLVDGASAVVGTSTAYARADHVHPKIPIDSTLSTTSENPVQNKVIQSALLNKMDVNANYNPIPLDFPDPENPPATLDGATITCGLDFADILELYQLAIDTSFELLDVIQNHNFIVFHPFRINDVNESIELFSIFDNMIYTITLEPNIDSGMTHGMVGTLHVKDSVTVDSALSLSSTNPVTNSAITTAIANNRGKVFYGVVDNTSTATAFTAQIPGITAYEEGLVVILKNGVVTSASGFTININGLGALPAYTNLGAESRETTIFNVAYTMMFVYEHRVSGGDWLCYRGSDTNTNTIGYQLRTNSMSLPMKSVTYRYRLLFTSADGAHFVPANNTTSTNATSSRAVCQDKINPFGPIYYYGTTASVAANSRPSATYLWEQYIVSLGYSFNRTGAALTLSSWKPVYVKCAPQADGSAIMDATTPYVQDLPTTADGKIYIFLGVAYSATNIELVAHHPVYCYRNGGIQEWTGVQAEIDALTARINNLIDGDEVSY